MSKASGRRGVCAEGCRWRRPWDAVTLRRVLLTFGQTHVAAEISFLNLPYARLDILVWFK